MKIIILSLFIICASGVHAAEVVNMAAISMIESSNNPSAFNEKEGARGLCQIRPAVLEEFNQRMGQRYTAQDLFNGKKNLLVAYWYMNIRIPEMLRAYKIQDTVQNRIIAYNFGIGNLVRNRKLPRTTQNYLLKYEAIVEAGI